VTVTANVRMAMLQTTSDAGIRRRVKRDTAMVSYNILDAQHSGDGVILLVSLRSYDTHLSVTFISEMQRTTNSATMFVSYGATPVVNNYSMKWR